MAIYYYFVGEPPGQFSEPPDATCNATIPGPYR